MKKAKLYTTICLIVVMIVASCPAVFASGVISYGMTWLSNPVEGVRGYVYASSPHGFIVRDYETDSTALVNDRGAVIPSSNKYFTYVGEDGIISYYDNNSGGQGIMDANGNIIIAPGSYHSVYSLTANRFAFGGPDSNGEYIYGVIDRNHNVIIPCVYDYIRGNGSGLIYCSNDNGDFVYDVSGKLISHFAYNERGYVQLLPSTDDKFLYSEYTDSGESTTFVHTSGKILASINCSLHPLSNSVLCGTEYTSNGYTYYYYDFNGNLLGSEGSEDWWRVDSLYEKYLSGDKTSKYEVDYRDGRELVVDQAGNVIFSNPNDLSMWEIYDDRFITVYDYDNGHIGLYEIDGTPLIAPDYYDDIYYCKQLDIFAFEKDNQISIAKFTLTNPPVSVTVYGNPVSFDQPPVIKEGRTLVPVRAISEALGASVAWDDATKTVTATLGGTVVKLVINSKQMVVNGKTVEIDVPAEIINGRTLIPARAISEAFGCQVNWDEANRRVIIN